MDRGSRRPRRSQHATPDRQVGSRWPAGQSNNVARSACAGTDGCAASDPGPGGATLQSPRKRFAAVTSARGTREGLARILAAALDKSVKAGA